MPLHRFRISCSSLVGRSFRFVVVEGAGIALYSNVHCRVVQHRCGVSAGCALCQVPYSGLAAALDAECVTAVESGVTKAVFITTRGETVLAIAWATGGVGFFDSHGGSDSDGCVLVGRCCGVAMGPGITRPSSYGVLCANCACCCACYCACACVY